MIDGTCTSCAAGYTGNNCTACASGTFKPNTGPGNCTLCPVNKISLEASTQITDCFCNGGTGHGSGVCTPCKTGEFIFRDEQFQNLLSTNRPFIVSEAANWNNNSARFDNTCANNVCAGSTGRMVSGTVTTGTVSANGAAAPVTFVGGDINTKMQWDGTSIPSTFTVCSVTRYSGQSKSRTLTCQSGTNWVHAQHAGAAGATHYGSTSFGNLYYTISPNTDWVVTCGRNLLRKNSVGSIANQVTTALATGGGGNCPLWINPHNPSDWQLSKLYIWNYHLSDYNFTLASLSLYRMLSENTTAAGVCLACSPNSQSVSGATVCTCNAGYIGADGAPCFVCPVNTFKDVIGPASCEVCPANSVSVPGTSNIVDCICNTGFSGPNGGPCTACPANTFKSEIGSSPCLPCLNSNSTIGSTNCVCSVGWMGWSFPMNVARTCGPSYNGQCSSDMTSIYSSLYSPSKGNDGDLKNSVVSGASGGIRPLFYRIDFETEREIDYVLLYNRPGSEYRLDFSTITVGNSMISLNNGICATLDAGLVQNRSCGLRGEYISVVQPTPFIADGYLQFNELQAYTTRCQQCPAGKYKNTIGPDTCTDCPPNSFSPPGSGSIAACTGCMPGYFKSSTGSCTVCLAGTYKGGSGISACTAYTCPAGKFSSDMKANTAATCWTCPSKAVLLAGNTNPVGCVCSSGTYQDTSVLNVPYSSRTYSSIFPGNHIFSMLDDTASTTSWSAGINQIGEWMEMDTGEPMHIHGIITQGRGASSPTQWVTQFKVEYRLDIAVGSALTFPETFTMASLKKEHIFSTPVYARYVRIYVLAWNVHPSMRAALIVRSCSSCPSNGFSAQGSTSIYDCKCPAGAYNDTTAVKRRAIAFVPGRAQFSTLANRNNRAYMSTAQFDITKGPPGSNGAVTFDRTMTQYMDGGPHTFNISTNGGFTAVVLVKLTGSIAKNERIIDFGNNLFDNIYLFRNGESKGLSWSIRNGNSDCMVSTPGVLFVEQDIWLTIVLTYNSNDMTISLKVGDNVAISRVCTPRNDRSVLVTYVGRSAYSVDSYTQISIAGVYAIDAALSDNEIKDIITDMETGKDTLVGCDECSVNTFKESVGNDMCMICPDNSFTNTAGSTNSSNCKCRPGYTGADGGNCLQCPGNTYKIRFGSASCTTCPIYSTSLPGSTLLGACVCNEGYTGPENSICLPCGAGTYKQNDFSDLVRLDKPYIVSTAEDWNSTTGRFDSVCGVEICKGSTGVNDMTSLTVLALLLNPVPELASVSYKTSAATGSTLTPTYIRTGGPNGNGEILYNTTNQQLINSNEHTLNFFSQGGFTFVAVVRFTILTTSVANTRVLYLDGRNGFLTISRTSSGSTQMNFQIVDSSGNSCNMWSNADIIQNVWLPLVAMYEHKTKTISWKIGNGGVRSGLCSVSLSKLDFNKAAIGGGTPSFQGSVAGLLMVNMLLDNTEIDSIIASMYSGEDMLRAGQAGLVSVGVETGNGAVVPVSFVEGAKSSKMQWGKLSVPAEFTICSVTRYTGETNERILTSLNNPMGNANFLHGHVSGYAGMTLYGDSQDKTNIFNFSISPNTDWVVVCGRNIQTANSDSVVVNGVTKSIAAGGVGSCALGINYENKSNWQLSKLYIWDYHLSNEKFALASTSLYAELLRNITNGICMQCPVGTFQSNTGSPICTNCPVDSTTYDTNSKFISDCKCRPGYAGKDGGGCLQCSANTFKIAFGNEFCTACPTHSTSLPGSTLLDACVCKEGYTGPENSICLPCGAGTYKQKDFSDLVRLDKPYIVSTADDWNSTTGRFDSVCGVEVCAGNTGVNDKTSLTALALIPNNLPKPVFTSELMRRTYMGSVLPPTYNATGSPTGNGDVFFDRTKTSFLDAGLRTFNIFTNGGFTFVTVAKFTGTAAPFEMILAICPDLSSLRDIIQISRVMSDNHMRVQFRNGLDIVCETTLYNSITTDKWLDIVVSYRGLDQKLNLTVNGVSSIQTCTIPVTNKIALASYIGKNFANTNIFHGKIAGLFVVDTFLDDIARDEIIDNIYAGEDLLRAGHPRIISSGHITGNGATVSIPYVGGGGSAKIQWGRLSVPEEFTICSVTRYTGEQNERILTSLNNPMGNANFLHGHVSGYAGTTLYGDSQDKTNLYSFSISPNTDWVVVCGRNIETPNSDSVIVNGVTKSISAGGVGNCALGINFVNGSSWQLSKLYIWDYHLSDENFALASTSLYGELSKNIRDGVCVSCPIGTFQSNTGSTICTTCPADSTTYDTNSKLITDCKCRPGYGGRDGGQCLPCLAGTFKRGLGSTCSACQKGKYNSMVGSNSSRFCLSCETGKFHKEFGATSADTCNECSCRVSKRFN